MITHLHGLACDMDVIPRLCAERGVPLIEDAAQAFGARFGGRPVGSFGDVGIFSFGKYKNVNAFLGGVLGLLQQSPRAWLQGGSTLDEAETPAEIAAAILAGTASNSSMKQPAS